MRLLGDVASFIPDTRILEELQAPRNKTIMVIGSSDAGKTTLVEHLADFLSQERTLGIVDLDTGQSHIGPPTTIAWGRVRGGFRGWEDITAEDFYFTGSTTPFGNLLPVIVGAKLVTDAAAAHCKKLIIDTTGMVAGPAGSVLKQFKIDILAPDIVLALAAGDELDPILAPLMRLKSPKIRTLRVPPSVAAKTTAKRSLHRSEMMRRYFAGAAIREVPFEEAGIRFTREPYRRRLAEFRNRVVSFRDEGNRDIALGVIERVSMKERKIMVRTPMSGERRFAVLVIGNAEIGAGGYPVKEAILRRTR